MKNKNTKIRKLTLKEEWIILKYELKDIWGNNYFKRNLLTFWAYFKLFLAMLFVRDEFSSLLEIDINAMSIMNSKKLEKYGNIASKVRLSKEDSKQFTYSLQEFILETCNQKNIDNFTYLYLIVLPAALFSLIMTIFKISQFTMILFAMTFITISYITIIYAKNDHKKQIKRRREFRNKLIS